MTDQPRFGYPVPASIRSGSAPITTGMNRSVALSFGLAVFLAACDSPAEPLRPEIVTAVSAPAQSAVVATAVADAPAVRVTNAAGRPVPDVAVTFTAFEGGGSINGAVQRTDRDGIARLGAWTVGTRSGTNIVHARAEGIAGLPVEFRVTGIPDVPARLAVAVQPPALAGNGIPVTPPPAVQLLDRFANTVSTAGIAVSAELDETGATLTGGTALTNTNGLAVFNSLALSGNAGPYTLRFAAQGLAPQSALEATTLLAAPAACSATLPLDLGPGDSRRFTMELPGTPSCLHFDAVRNAGQQYLVMLENMPMQGAYDAAVFPGAGASDAVSAFSLYMQPLVAIAPVEALVMPNAWEPQPASWDFGAGVIHEGVTPDAPGESRRVFMLRAGSLVDIDAADDVPAVGDTLVIPRLEGIARLSILTGQQRAIVRHVSAELIIAEDVRLPTLTREGGEVNTPIPADTLRAIAEQYAAQARVQADMLFEGRHNNTTDANGGRIVAVHSLMYANNIWGYTYPGGNYFVWDYWVGTNGSTAGLNQRVQRNADNLFMHEIAHMRHFGVVERAGSPPRGNRWLVEGFARFSERLPIAARLLGSNDPSRTANVLLPINSGFNGTYFRDDVPTFLNGGSSMFEGYQASSFVFDYFADQVALRGGDWRAALRDFLVGAGNRATLDAAIARWLPGRDFPSLFTQARIALYLDDAPGPTLPPETQYHQFRLRDSRPAGSAAASDPRTAWQKLPTGTFGFRSGFLPRGGAIGFVIDGTIATASSAVLNLAVPRTADMVVSVTRIR